jgi:large subunit ribosomal protein L29
MKQSVIKEMTSDEIAERIEVEAATLSQLRMNHKVSALESPVQIREKRRAIARLKTELRKRQLNEQTK